MSPNEKGSGRVVATPQIASAVGTQLGQLEYAEVVRTTISWRAILAGFFISLLTYLILTSLGVAIGASTATQAIERGTGGRGLGIGAAIWLLLSTLISLFVGGYAAGRSGGIVPARLGRMEGFVVAALFFGFLLMQVGNTIGLLGQGLGSSVGALGGAAGSLGQDPRVQQTIESAISESANLRAPVGEVAQGVAERLIRGDEQGARDYLARQAGMSRAEADRAIRNIQAQVQGTLRDVGTATTQAVSVAGWTLFGTFFLGALAALLGGSAGARANLSRPVSDADARRIRNREVA